MNPASPREIVCGMCASLLRSNECRKTAEPRMRRDEAIRPGAAFRPGFEDHTVCSDPSRKFSILLDSLTTCQICVLTCSDWIRRVLSVELSRFYHGGNLGVPTRQKAERLTSRRS